MAFDGLFQFIDRLQSDYNNHKAAAELSDSAPIRTKNYQAAAKTLQNLTDYYETVLSHNKFKSQREYCKQALIKMNPAFAEGYFKIKTKK